MEGEVRGLKSMKNYLLDHPISLDSQPLLTAAHLTCPSSDSLAASLGATPPAYLSMKPKSPLRYS